MIQTAMWEEMYGCYIICTITDDVPYHACMSLDRLENKRFLWHIHVILCQVYNKYFAVPEG